jgi:glycosyltransferase involved in cell wall biosynthesis
MRILVLSYEFPPVGGGGGRVAEDICRVLAAREHEIYVQTAHWNGLPLVEEKDGYTIHRIRGIRRSAFACSVHEMAAFVLTSIVPAIRHTIQWKPDILHVHFAVPTGVVGWIVRRVTGTPYLLSTQLGDVPGGVPEQTDHLFRWIKPFTIPIWKDAAAVTVPSGHIARMAVESYGICPEIIPNGVDNDGLRQSSETGHTPVRIVFCGRFNAQKNLIFMMDVLVRIRELEWQLDMIGDGPLMGPVIKKVRDAGIEDRVVFHGWVPPDRAESVMNESDILFLPSLSEGMPVVGGRALGAGLAIVGSNVGGIDDLVQNGENGFLCPVNDAEGFENALRRLLTSGDLLTAMKKKSRAEAQRLDLQTIVTRYEKLFESAVFHKGSVGNSPLRICYVIDSLRRDGAQKVLVNLVKGLALRGYDQRVYCLNDAAEPDIVRMLMESGAAVEIIGKAKLLSGYGGLRVLSEFRSRRPHIVQTFLFFSDVVGRALARAAGVPVIVSSIQTHNVDKTKYQLFLDRLTARWADRVVVCSKYLVPFVLAREGVTPGQLVYIPNGIETTRYRSRSDSFSIRSKLGIAPSTKLFGMVARLYPQKGHRYLIEAFARVSRQIEDSILLIIGDGPLLGDLKSTAARLGIETRVRFLGERSDVPDLLSCMNVYVHSSLWEGMPNAVMEAMVAGKPVVATAVDGNNELIVEGKTGWLVKPANSAALADGMIWAATHESEAEKIAAAASQYVESKFSAEVMVSGFDAVYRNQLNEACLESRHWRRESKST